MNPTDHTANLATALASPNSSSRLQAAMTAGTHPRPDYVEALVARSGTEPDFLVRDTLTWALVMHPLDAVLPRVLAELDSENPRAVSQALHTLSKLGDARAWPAITDAHLHSADDDIARTAWRAAAAVAPATEHPRLAAALVSELGRGDIDTMRSSAGCSSRSVRPQRGPSRQRQPRRRRGTTTQRSHTHGRRNG